MEEVIQVYLKPNSEAPSIVPEPPKFLTEKDYAIQHVPKLQNSVSDETVHQLLDDRRTAEELYAIIFSEKNELEDFINQLKRNIQAYERFQVRVRRIYDYLKGNDVAVMATAKLLQKDLYIAERTVENLQIENQAFMATIQDYEEKQLKDNKLRTENEASLTHIKIQFQQLAEKVDEKNEMLGNAEERFQDHLIKMEQASSAATDTSKKLITAQGEIAFIKSELGASQLRESQLTDLNSELAQALSKLQNRN
jgi:chromosome segregation ATPase